MADEIIAQRKCRACGRELPLTSFSSNGMGGLRHQCQTCNADACFAHALKGKSDEEIARAKEKRQQMLARRDFEQAHPDMKWCQQGAHFQPRSIFSINTKLPSGLQSCCKECKRTDWANNREHHRAKAKKWREANVEQRKKRDAECYARNRETCLSKCKEYRKAHKEEIRETQRRHYTQNRDKRRTNSNARYHSKSAEICAQQKQRRDDNLEHFHQIERRRYRARRDVFRQRAIAYYRTHKQKWQSWGGIKRAARYSAPGAFTIEQLVDKFAYHGWRCYLCRIPLTPESVHTDHRKPFSRGGSNWIANIAPCCQSCNQRKHSKTESEFRSLIAA